MLKQFNIGLIDKDDSLLLAISGGIDSMVMLDYFINLKDSMNLKLSVAYVDHQRREDSYLDYQLIDETCKKHKIPLYTTKLEYEPQINFHSYAHKKRYDFFVEICYKIKANKIVLAHNANDNAETITMRLVRGSSFEGYRGIMPISTYKDITVIRPLLMVSRHEIISYQKEHNVKYNEDSSNSEDNYTRNRYRHYVLPIFEQENPKYLDKFIQFSHYQDIAYQLIKKTTTIYLNNNLVKTKKGYLLNVDDFKSTEEIVQIEAIKEIVNTITDNSVELAYRNIIDIKNLFYNQKPHVELKLNDRLFVYKTYDLMYFENTKPEEYNFRFLVSNESTITLPNNDLVIITKKPNKNYDIIFKLCYNNLDLIFPLTIRNRIDGDKIKTTSGTKKLKDIFINKKIPKLIRNKIPIVLNKNDEIIFVPNIFKAKTKGNNCIYIIYLEGK